MEQIIQQNNLPSVKELIKDNEVTFAFYRQGNFYYNIKYYNELGDKVDIHEGMGDFINFDTYQFPVPDDDIGSATLEATDKAIYYMRWINHSIKEGTFIKL